MSTVDANRVILTGENSVIRLNNNDSDSFTSNATFWRVVSSPGGPGHVLYLKSELTEARWRIYSDNIAMARWLQSTVLGVISAELLDLTIAVTDAQFSKSGDAREAIAVVIAEPNDRIFPGEDHAVRIYSAHDGCLQIGS